MATRDEYMHYDVEDLEQDIGTLRSLGRLYDRQAVGHRSASVIT